MAAAVFPQPHAAHTLQYKPMFFKLEYIIFITNY